VWATHVSGCAFSVVPDLFRFCIDNCEQVQWQLPLALATASKSASSGRGAAHCPGALAAILAEGGARKLEAGLRCSRQTEMKDQA